MSASGDVTRLLAAWSEGDREALDDLIPIVYSELHRMARRCFHGQPSQHTLQPTVLIHEAYLRLSHQGQKQFADRAHFFAVASLAMRQILVNHAQSRLTEKRGGGSVQVPIDDLEVAAEQEAREVLALHDALKQLEALDARKCRVVELRYFGGLSVEETAETLGVSTMTITRDWQAARAWLARELGASGKEKNESH